MASDGGHRGLMSPCPFAGSADEAMLLLNTLQKAGGRDRASDQMDSPLYSGGGRRLRSFFSSSSFQYLKLSSRCCMRSGRSTKAGERTGHSVFTRLYLWVRAYFLSGSGTWAFYHRAMPCPSILRKARKSAVM